MNVLNFGSLNIDYVYDVDHFVAKGETISSARRQIFRGGKGLNQSTALGRAGVKVFHAGAVGSEGKFLTDFLEESGVDVSYVRQTEGACGHAIIQVDKTGDNCILLFGGANREIDEAQVDEVLSHFETGDVLVLQNEISCLGYIIDRAYDRGMKIAFNPSPYDSNIAGLDLSKISLFFVNEVEASQLTGKDAKDTDAIIEGLRSSFKNAETVLTMGSRGAAFIDASQAIFREACRTEVVDTTAAGDTFMGYFIAGMIEGMSPEECLKLASKASAVTISRKGAAPSIPFRKELG